LTETQARGLSPGCRAVELSRLRRAVVEAVVEALPVEPCRALSSLSSSCRAPSRLTTCGGASSCCRGLSRAVEFLCRGCRKAVELCRVCCRAREWHVALLFCMKHSDSHSSRPRGPTHKPPTKLQGLQTLQTDKELGDRTSQPIDTT
jgi:hypothetical protein